MERSRWLGADGEWWTEMPEDYPGPGDPCPKCGEPLAGGFVDGRDPETDDRWGGIGGHCFKCSKPVEVKRR